jgi:hypothetical protein
MACRGWYTALLPDEADALLAAPDTDDRIELLESLYESADADDRILSVDKSWDAMHRVLCGGWLDATHGDAALRPCVIGGQPLSDQDDWIISYVPPDLVPRVAAAIAPLTRDWFRAQYFALDRNPPGPLVHRYDADLTDDDFEYTWSYFTEVRDFYARAAARRLATVFAVDQ